jgi:hypothetical protein
MRKSYSEILPKNMITKYYKTMEVSVRAGEKQFNNIDFRKKERYNNLKGICDIHNKKIMNMLQKQQPNYIYQSNLLPKLNAFSIKKPLPVKTIGTGNGKHIGEKYDPMEYFYPIHQKKERNDFGSPYLY